MTVALEHRRPWPWALVPVLAAAATSLWIGLNFDVRYAFGGLRVAPEGVYGAFIHRPLAYRVFVALLDLPTRLFTDRTGTFAEAVVRAEVLVLVAAVTALVWFGLHRREVRGAGFIALALGIALALAPNWTFLEPDWTGALWATAAFGAALLPSRFAAPLAGLFAVLCVATKLSTLPYAVIAIVAACLVVKGWSAVGWSAGFGGLWVLVTWLFLPTEWQWTQDMAGLFPYSLPRAGLDLDWRTFGESAANLLVVSPIVLALPAAAVRRPVPAAGRPVPAGPDGPVPAGAVWRPVLVLAGVVLIAAGALVQGEGYLYQWAALPVFAAGVVAATRSVAALVPAAVGGLASAFVLYHPAAWRSEHFAAITVVFLVIAALGVFANRLRVPRNWVPWAAIAMTLAFGAANLPHAAYSVNMAHAAETNTSLFGKTADLRTRFLQARTEIGPETPVLYLTFGDVDYLLGNPTDCRYASPVWLQRSTFLPYVRELDSYRDNVGCVENTRASWLVLDHGWLDPAKLEPAVRTRLTATFDCTAPLTVTDTIELCPRR